MVSEYQNLKNSLKWTLQVFKSKLLLFHVLRGGVIIGISILFFLFFYFFCNSFFQLSVLWKTLYFYVFISVLSLECIFFIFHPFIRFLLHANLKNNLLLKEIYGILLVFGIQISGYLFQQEGVSYLSLMAKAIPGYAIDGTGGQWKVVVLFCAILLILALFSLWLIGRVDFKDEVEEE